MAPHTESILVDIANAIVSELNDAANAAEFTESPTPTATFVWAPDLSLDEVWDTLTLHVSPTAHELEPESRSTSKNIWQVDVAVTEGLNGNQSEMNQRTTEIARYVQSLMYFLNLNQFTGSLFTYRVVQVTAPVLFDPEELRDNHRALTVIRLYFEASL